MGELDAAEARDMLRGRHVGRLGYGGDPTSVVSVKYSAGEPDHVHVQTADALCGALAQQQAPVRFEVDDVDGPARWSTVIGWGFFEKPTGGADEGSGYRIRVTDLRGFYRGARR